MERKITPLKILSMLDLTIAFVPIIYGLCLIVPPIIDFFMDQKIEEDPTATPPGPGPVFHYDNQLTLAVYITIIVIFLLGIHSFQALMAALLFSASTKVITLPLEATRKFKLFLLWSLIFLVFNLIVLIVYLAVVKFYYVNWLVLSFLIIQVVFRLLCLFYVQVCRKAIRDQFLESQVPWISPQLNPTL